MGSGAVLIRTVRRAAELPPRVLLRKVIGKLVGPAHAVAARHRDQRYGTYSRGVWPETEMLRRGHFAIPAETLRPGMRWISGVAAHYLEHRFDLLGSGWTRVTYGMRCRGLHGVRFEPEPPVRADPAGAWLLQRMPAANAQESARLWCMIEGAYEPIDWQLDWKSGYRWSERTWYRDIHYRGITGADVKVPWELSRMQHLALLAHAFALSADGTPGMRPADEYRREFRNQLTDFIATNPPRFGVNWSCTMDVAIRAANWIVAYDLFRNAGAAFDATFEALLTRSIAEHAEFIVGNLEWSPELRGNHYLANVVGLLFCAAYLPRSPRVDAWLAFAVQELVNAVSEQFLPDGANFEASTCYHRLSAEMVVYGTALIQGLPAERLQALISYDHRFVSSEPGLRPAPVPLYPHPDGGTTPFPAWYCERMERMAEFAMHVLKRSGRIPQFGDNDNGRFLKLQPVYHERTVADAVAMYENLDGYTALAGDRVYWDEDHLDPRHLIAAINGFFSRADLRQSSGPEQWERQLIQSVSGGRCLASYRASGTPSAATQVRIGATCDWEQCIRAIESIPRTHRRCLELAVPGPSIRTALTLYAYPAFGIYIFRSERMVLAVRCGPVGQNGRGGHAHSDQLSLELELDGIDIVRDPGTYLYTPLPHLRNAYRSARVHAGPWLASDDEPARLDDGPFVLSDSPVSACTYFGAHGFAGVARGRLGTAYCTVRITDNRVVVLHGIDARSHAPLAPRVVEDEIDGILYSPAYGVRMRNHPDAARFRFTACDSAECVAEVS